jgi:hypothetical protein
MYILYGFDINVNSFSLLLVCLKYTDRDLKIGITVLGKSWVRITTKKLAKISFLQDRYDK